MKPLYWKLLLILGAMIVGASLAVPKALRKNSIHIVGNASQTLFLTGLSKSTSFDTTSGQDEKVIVTVDKVKSLPNIHNTKFPKLSFLITISFKVVENAPSHSLSAGTRPTKSRVIY